MVARICVSQLAAVRGGDCNRGHELNMGSNASMYFQFERVLSKPQLIFLACQKVSSNAHRTPARPAQKAM
jgi:hypothetical protein